MSTYKCPVGHTYEAHAHLCPRCLTAAGTDLERIRSLAQTPHANPDHFADKLKAIDTYAEAVLKALGRSPL